MGESFLNGRVLLHPGNCLDVLARLEECSIDSCVTDPPYGLKFMGRAWDHGVPGVLFWQEVLRVLKPGAHLVACGGTRTYHRMACAIEDAGFEIRDTISWLYGSGFPKSHDVSKGIDRRKDWSALPQLQQTIRAARQDLNISQSEAARRMGLIPADEDLGGGGFMWFETGMRMPTREQWPRLKATLGINDEFDGCFEAAEREVIRRDIRFRNSDSWEANGRGMLGIGEQDFSLTAPATDAARQWQGWGTALKPACELIVLARKPLSEGTVAANVLRWGTGAINVDGCRVSFTGDADKNGWKYGAAGKENKSDLSWKNTSKTIIQNDATGRWPANVVHDGSDEVVAAFPDVQSNDAKGAWGNGYSEVYGKLPTAPKVDLGRGDTGSAARFFYTAKADADDRLGSKHPTVKPLDLMQWLVRMVTPKGGVCLDPFAGTGTTAEAAFREGMRAVLIEAEPEYQADIRRRMALVLAGPDERTRESIKAKNLPVDYGPLFGFPEAAE